MYYVYVLYNREKSKRYVGYTSNLKRRFAEHNSNHHGYTGRLNWELVYYEAFNNEKSARTRERRLKQDGRAKRQLFSRIFED